jgi:hypothetical protein
MSHMGQPHSSNAESVAEAGQRAQAMADAYEERIRFQVKRITNFIKYLEEKELLRDFNAWELTKQQEEASGK